MIKADEMLVKNSLTRADRIKEKLACLEPSYLQIIDESTAHANHFEATSPETHLKLMITTTQFSGLNRLKQHKLINELLSSEFEDGLHALTIKIIDEAKNDTK